MCGVIGLIAVALCGRVALGEAADAAKLDQPLETLCRFGTPGNDDQAASSAWQQLSQSPPEHLPQMISALDGATPLGANWIRSAIDSVAERTLQGGGKLPLKDLETLLQQTQHAPQARRLSYEWIVRADPASAERLIAGLLNDPSLELRRDAVARQLDQAGKLLAADDKPAAEQAYDVALRAARDQDQVTAASEALKKLGHPVDLATLYGFLRRWTVTGPFDNIGKRGYDVAYPPESKVDTAGQYDGKHGAVRWQEHTTDDEMGQVDLNALLGKEKGVLAYCVAEFTSPEACDAQLRMGSECANKIWLNGKLVFERNVYHSYVKMDQYVAPVQLKQGRNVVMLKICQNEQTEEWAVDWKFQIRVCDATGGAIPLDQGK